MKWRIRRPDSRFTGVLCLLTVSGVLAQPVLPLSAQAGDLIFRRGTETVSHMVLGMDGGLYSHVGMLVGQSGNWQVVHATPSEKAGQADGVVLDSLEFFLAPRRSQAFAVYSPKNVSSNQRRSAVQWALAQQGRGFEIVAAGKGIYCTTLVWQAWKQAGLDWPVNTTEVTLPVLKGHYLLPSALQTSAQMQRLN
ncbi:YiiX/YebB-like N1pC/P60 family cysteine hydrolase [Comamonas fluminis]|uniref:YiiX/YebB-like N1pC/P60 family cysteine hydrolase n=1 Tax=Comamonas fluminis TaxID=2796366 RepID=UPI001FE2DB47|nr:YiiX/YebB-like N1pC/P60 family cysteine hydrolase [Comamonas fluminis]